MTMLHRVTEKDHGRDLCVMPNDVIVVTLTDGPEIDWGRDSQTVRLTSPDHLQASIIACTEVAQLNGDGRFSWEFTVNTPPSYPYEMSLGFSPDGSNPGSWMLNAVIVPPQRKPPRIQSGVVSFDITANGFDNLLIRPLTMLVVMLSNHVYAPSLAYLDRWGWIVVGGLLIAPGAAGVGPSRPIRISDDNPAVLREDWDFTCTVTRPGPFSLRLQNVAFDPELSIGPSAFTVSGWCIPEHLTTHEEIQAWQQSYATTL